MRSATILLIILGLMSACKSMHRLPEAQEDYFIKKYSELSTFEHNGRLIYSPDELDSSPTPLFTYESMMIVTPGERPTGSIMLGLIVNKRGQTEFIVPLKVTGKKIDSFIDRVIKHYKGRNFIPAIKDGESVASMFIVRQRFNPEDYQLRSK